MAELTDAEYPVRFACKWETEFDPGSGYHEVLHFEVFNRSEKAAFVRGFGLDLTLATSDEWHERTQASRVPPYKFPYRLEPNEALHGWIHWESFWENDSAWDGRVVGYVAFVTVDGYGHRTLDVPNSQTADKPSLVRRCWSASRRQARRPRAWLKSRSSSHGDQILIALIAAAAIAVTTALWLAFVDGDQDARSKADSLVSVTVRANPALADPKNFSLSSASFWFPKRLSAVGRPPGPDREPWEACRKWRSWALANGGYDADVSFVEVLVQAHAGAAVAITGMDVSTQRRRSVPGVQVTCASGGAEPNRRRIFVDLDRQPPAVTYAGIEETPAPKPLEFTLRETETEVLEITAKTRTCRCEWRGRLGLLVNGERLVMAIDDKGAAFRTVATGRSPHYLRTGTGWDRYRQ